MGLEKGKRMGKEGREREERWEKKDGGREVR